MVLLYLGGAQTDEAMLLQPSRNRNLLSSPVYRYMVGQNAANHRGCNLIVLRFATITFG